MKLYQYHNRCNCSGLRIKQQRENLGLSQEQLAARLRLYGIEMGQKTISRIETGLRVVPDYELLWFARALETTSSWLLGEQE